MLGQWKVEGGYAASLSLIKVVYFDCPSPCHTLIFNASKERPRTYSPRYRCNKCSTWKTKTGQVKLATPSVAHETFPQYIRRTSDKCLESDLHSFMLHRNIAIMKPLCRLIDLCVEYALGTYMSLKHCVRTLSSPAIGVKLPQSTVSELDYGRNLKVARSFSVGTISDVTLLALSAPFNILLKHNCLALC